MKYVYIVYEPEDDGSHYPVQAFESEKAANAECQWLNEHNRLPEGPYVVERMELQQ